MIGEYISYMNPSVQTLICKLQHILAPVSFSAILSGKKNEYMYGTVFFSNNEHFMGIPFYYKMLVEHKIIFTLKALLEELSHNESP